MINSTSDFFFCRGDGVTVAVSGGAGACLAMKSLAERYFWFRGDVFLFLVSLFARYYFFWVKKIHSSHPKQQTRGLDPTTSVPFKASVEVRTPEIPA